MKFFRNTERERDWFNRELNGKDKIKAVRAVTATWDGTGIINLWIIAN